MTSLVVLNPQTHLMTKCVAISVGDDLHMTFFVGSVNGKHIWQYWEDANTLKPITSEQASISNRTF